MSGCHRPWPYGNATAWYPGNGNLTPHFKSGDEFLFTTGDFSRWLIVTHDEAIGENYDVTSPRTVVRSSVNDSEHTLTWFNRSGNAEDPLIWLKGHITDVHNLAMYVENSNTSYVAARHASGMKVYTRTPPPPPVYYRYTFEINVPNYESTDSGTDEQWRHLPIVYIKANGYDIATWDKFSSATALLSPNYYDKIDLNTMLDSTTNLATAWMGFDVDQPGTRLFEMVFTEKITSFEIISGRPKYAPGWNIYEDGVLMVSESANRGPAETPEEVAYTYNLPTQGLASVFRLGP